MDYMEFIDFMDFIVQSWICKISSFEHEILRIKFSKMFEILRPAYGEDLLILFGYIKDTESHPQVRLTMFET